jgi:prepilin-type N-terminal cleavage/methylation domain-containing protein
MFKTIKKAQKGFTIIELLIVIAIIAILALLVLNNFQGAQAKARDQQRTTDLNNLHQKLEEFFNENNYYPGSLDVNDDGNLTSTDLPGIDEGSFKDPKGSDNISEASVATAAAADAAAAPTGDTAGTASYAYITYPSSCTADCTGYRLKSFIEKPSTTTPNPFVKKSLN